MALTDTLPNQLCSGCAKSVTCVIPFIRLAKDSSKRWNQITDYLYKLEGANTKRKLKKRKNVYVIIDDDLRTQICTRYKEAPRWKRLENLKKNLNRMKTQNLEGKKCINAQVRCPECDKLFTQIYKLNLHMRVVNKKMCSYCKEICHIKKFNDHIKTHGISAPTCSICYKTYESADKFLNHKKRCKPLSHSCIDCNYSFSSSDQLIYHLPIHKSKTCSGCLRIFSNKACFQHHKKQCNSKPNTKIVQKYTCDHCSKTYIDKSVLKLHIFHTHMYGFQYQCEICGKKCGSRHNLEEHKNTHNKIIDRFVCEVCDSKFSTRRGYQKHLNNKGHHVPHISTDGKIQASVLSEIPTRYKYKLQCAVCYQKFAYKKSLRDHMKTNHEIVVIE